jgi:hypothetical protein
VNVRSRLSPTGTVSKFKDDGVRRRYLWRKLYDRRGSVEELKGEVVIEGGSFPDPDNGVGWPPWRKHLTQFVSCVIQQIELAGIIGLISLGNREIVAAREERIVHYLVPNCSPVWNRTGPARQSLQSHEQGVSCF